MAAIHLGIGGFTRILAAIAAVTPIALAIFFHPYLVGYALYHGYLPIKGRIAGHESDLPSRALRCSNCHDAAQGGTPITRTIAPLTAAALTESHSRRGGPETAYTESSFCSVLHDGIDPAYVMLNQTMPRYDLTPSSCHALWSYVASR